MKIATFNVDITPPRGFPMAYGLNEGAYAPVMIRGALINDGKSTVVMAAADVIFIGGKAHKDLRKALAKAAGTKPGNVFLHSVHQHDSLILWPEYSDVVEKYFGEEPCSKGLVAELSADLAKSVAAARKRWAVVRSVATAEKRVEGLGANRRILGANGKVEHIRWSRCSEPARSAPTGLIDPALRTLAFIGEDDRILCAMHFYASHPQTANGRDMAGPDVPGAALEYATKNFPGCADNIYFNGCGANVTFGKYCLDDKEKSLEFLGSRLGAAIVSNLRRLEKKAPGRLVVKSASFDYPFKSKPKSEIVSADKALRKMDDYGKAMCPIVKMTMAKNWRKFVRTEVSRLSVGEHAHVLSLPSETMVEYQLHAQSLVPEKFLACAAYGDCSYMYIPTAAMFKEGGYEASPVACHARPVIEKLYKEAIFEVLKGLR